MNAREKRLIEIAKKNWAQAPLTERKGLVTGISSTALIDAEVKMIREVFPNSTDKDYSEPLAKFVNISIGSRPTADFIRELAVMMSIEYEKLKKLYDEVPFWVRRMLSHDKALRLGARQYSVYWQKFKNLPLWKDHADAVITYEYIGEGHQNEKLAKEFISGVMQDNTIAKGFLFKCLNLVQQLLNKAYSVGKDRFNGYMRVIAALGKSEKAVIVNSRAAIVFGAPIPKRTNQKDITIKKLFKMIPDDGTLFPTAASVYYKKVIEDEIKGKAIQFSVGGGKIASKKEMEFTDSLEKLIEVIKKAEEQEEEEEEANE